MQSAGVAMIRLNPENERIPLVMPFLKLIISPSQIAGKGLHQLIIVLLVLKSVFHSALKHVSWDDHAVNLCEVCRRRRGN